MPKFKCKPEHEKHTGKYIAVRLTQQDRLSIEKRAAAHNLSLSDYIRRCALGRPINTSNIPNLIVELCALANQQRECFKSDRRNEHEYRKILQAIVDVILSLPLRIPNKPKS